MTIYSTSFAKGQVLTGVDTTEYTAPATGLVVLRCLTLAAVSTGSTEGLIWDPSGVVIFDAKSAAQYDSFVWNGRFVMTPGEELNVFAISGNWQFSISGYYLL